MIINKPLLIMLTPLNLDFNTYSQEENTIEQWNENGITTKDIERKIIDNSNVCRFQKE